MATISLCMIVKNEADVLSRCLNSVKAAVDEIIIVDTGSTDATVELAHQFTDTVFSIPWTDDFAAARNISFEKATMDYCMWLDADDILLDTDRKGLIALKQTLKADVVMMRYHTAFDTAGRPTFSYYRERIVRNVKQPLWQGRVHEVITPFGEIIYSELAITHAKQKSSDANRNLRIYQKQIEQGQPLSPREQFYFARELYSHGYYKQSAAVLETFLLQNLGWIENNIEACRVLAFCHYKLGDDTDALLSLLRSFSYDVPRACLCCDIGWHFFDRARYMQAVYWYERALACPKQAQTGAFELPDCYNYIPYLQLCVCHDRLGNARLAQFYNEKAGAIKPDSEQYLANKAYFQALFSS